jgi:ATP-dependent Clp protease adaptor protein ClpS
MPTARMSSDGCSSVGGSAPRSRKQEVVTAMNSEIGTEQIVVPDTVEELLGDLDSETDVPWIVLVWDDPINLMDYVTYVFQKLFGYSREKARHLMLQVHNEGKAVVSSGTRERCENDVSRLHAHGLWATMQHDR